MPKVAPLGITKSQVILVPETTLTLLPAISVAFVALWNFTVALVKNPVPAKLVICTVVPVAPELGVTPVTVGARLS